MELERPRNRLLRLQRELRGWSQDDVAAGLHRLATGLGESEVGVDATMVSRWERGTRKPRPRYVRLLSILFELPVEELGVVGEEDLGQPEPVPGVREDDDEAGRAFLSSVSALLGVAALPPAFPPAGSEPWQRLAEALDQRTCLDGETVSHLEHVTVALEHLESTRVGSRALIGPVSGHLEVISLLLRGSLSPDLRRRLCSIAGETAGFAAWLYWNTGDRPRAGAYLRTALTAAREAGDRALGIALVASAATQSPGQENPEAWLDQLQGTSDFTPVHSTPSNAVWMAAKRADAYAELGLSDQCRRALDRASTLLRRVDAEGPERRPRFMVLDAIWLAGEQGASLAKLGRTDEARQLLRPVLAALGPSSERDRVWLLLALATTYVRDRQPEEAARLARVAFAAASKIGLEPVLQQLRQLSADLRAMDASTAVRELEAEVAAL